MSYSCAREGLSWDGVTCPPGERYTTAGICPKGTRCSVSNANGRCCGDGTRIARGYVAEALRGVGFSHSETVTWALKLVPNSIKAIEILQRHAPTNQKAKRALERILQAAE